MRTKYMILLFALPLGAFWGTANAGAAPTYTITDLGVLPGGVSSTATAIDAAGEVVGYTTFADNTTEAFYWTQAGGMIGLGGTNSKAFGVNGGDVVGISNTQAFRWTSATGITVIDPGNQGRANQINSSGEVVGFRNAAGGTRVLAWSNTNTISNPFPAVNLTGVAINDLGQWVGINSGSSGYYYAGAGNARTNLSLIPDALSNTQIASGASSNIAAYEDLITLSTTSIGTLPGGTTSNALGINPAGTEIVGLSTAGATSTAFLYDIATHNLASVNSLLAPVDSGWSVTTASAITSAGNIAATATFAGAQHAVLLSVPEPGTFALAGCGAFLTALGFFGRRVGGRLNRDSGLRSQTVWGNRPTVKEHAPECGANLMNERYRLRQSLILIVVTLFAPFGRAVLAATVPAGSWAGPIPVGAGAGLSGEYFGRVYQETNDAALAYVANNPPGATFTAAHVDYPVGVTDSTYADSNTLLDFLGGPTGDGATLLPASVGSNTLDGQLITFTGYIALQSGTTYFNLGSDDGALLTIGGTTIADNGNTHFFSNAFGSATVAQAGLYPIDVTYYENIGWTGVTLHYSSAANDIGAVVPTSVLYTSVPEPGTFALASLSLVALMTVARRRRPQ